MHLRPGPNRKQIEYELLEVAIGEQRPFHILKMQNPSIEDTWHYEGVPESCETVLDAFEFRTGIRAIPEYLS